MKRLTAADAVKEIPSGATLGVTGFRWVGCAEALLRALRDRFLATGEPRDLTLMFSSASGDNVSTGLSVIAQAGLLRRVIGGFWGVTPQLYDLAVRNEIEAYNLPQGQIARLYGSIAAGQPGLVTEIGLDTFVDPRLEGGRLNARTTEDLLEVVRLRGREYLLYHAHPIHAAFIRGTSADASGNISFEDEAAFLESHQLALAAHNSGGKVFVQVKRILDRPMAPQAVAIPGHLVDFVVVADDIERDHRQTVRIAYDSALVSAGESMAASAPEQLEGERLIIATRAADELRPGDVVNLGQGIPSSIPQIVARRGATSAGIRFTLESGVIGGLPHPVPDFGVATHPSAIIRMDDQFVFYDGGGLDVSFLGFAEIDAEGSANVSKFGGRFVGCGGFMDIAQPTKRLVFCGGFRAGKLEVRMEQGRVVLANGGKAPKFVRKLQQRTFSGRYAREHGQQVKYVTERCVFELAESGLVLTEVAAGVDVDRDILEQMDFRPAIARELRVMPLNS